MIVDTSALIAILRDEPEARAFAIAIADADRRRLSAANYLEAAVVIDGSRDPIASRGFDDLLREGGIAIEPVTEEQAKVARQAYRDFGRGSGHAARLNFGDCFAYALAKTTGEPLLFKGDDFLHAGIAPYIG
ncbi:MAG: type II toxin-antitoxin system VapC family toxin [Acidobacteriaceae bacterium]